MRAVLDPNVLISAALSLAQRFPVLSPRAFLAELQAAAGAE
ncbi:MAG TPA: hypothetical protein VD769_00445 [Gaiellaceae bacterium]|nr:hypothetical protein [Gaiellaceae bacterium]